MTLYDNVCMLAYINVIQHSYVHTYIGLTLKLFLIV